MDVNLKLISNLFPPFLRRRYESLFGRIDFIGKEMSHGTILSFIKGIGYKKIKFYLNFFLWNEFKIELFYIFVFPN